MAWFIFLDSGKILLLGGAVPKNPEKKAHSFLILCTAPKGPFTYEETPFTQDILKANSGMGPRGDVTIGEAWFG